ncbi:hypothetical protein C9974_15260 [Marinobacter sp. B9-2]|nr:hypothetical protein C9974_15260 [Marinobacter sp. B9-2]
MHDQPYRILRKKCTLSRIKVGQLLAVDDLTISDFEIFLAPIPALKKPSELSDEAVVCLTLLHPPLVVKNSRDRKFRVVGNLRISELCQAKLPPSESIYAIQVDTLPGQYSVATALKFFEILSSISFGLDLSYVRNFFHRMMAALPEPILRMIGPHFDSKAGREKLLGVNRRHQTPSRNHAKSPTSQIVLGLED